MLDPKLSVVGQRMSRDGGRPHTYACPHCGQAVDKRDLAAVLYHEGRPHTPLAQDLADRVRTADAQLRSAMERK